MLLSLLVFYQEELLLALCLLEAVHTPQSMKLAPNDNAILLLSGALTTCQSDIYSSLLNNILK